MQSSKSLVDFVALKILESCCIFIYFRHNSCACLTLFHGERCQLELPADKLCQPGGNWVGGKMDGHCQCEADWFGEFCEHNQFTDCDICGFVVKLYIKNKKKKAPFS